jgi:hypothetical protein
MWNERNSGTLSYIKLNVSDENTYTPLVSHSLTKMQGVVQYYKRQIYFENITEIEAPRLCT